MQTDLAPEQDDIVRHAIATGRIARPEDAVAQAMDDGVGRERQRIELIVSLDEADAECERGEHITIATEEDWKIFVEDPRSCGVGSSKRPGRLMPHPLTKRAKADLDGIARFIIADRGRAAAIHLFDQLDRAFRMLSDHP